IFCSGSPSVLGPAWRAAIMRTVTTAHVMRACRSPSPTGDGTMTSTPHRYHDEQPAGAADPSCLHEDAADRVRDGKQFVTDGLFTETHGQLGGYFLIDAQDLDEAIGIAARISMAHKGIVESRPVIDIPGLPGD